MCDSRADIRSWMCLSHALSKPTQNTIHSSTPLLSSEHPNYIHITSLLCCIEHMCEGSFWDFVCKHKNQSVLKESGWTKPGLIDQWKSDDPGPWSGSLRCVSDYDQMPRESKWMAGLSRHWSLDRSLYCLVEMIIKSQDSHLQLQLLIWSTWSHSEYK